MALQAASAWHRLHLGQGLEEPPIPSGMHLLADLVQLAPRRTIYGAIAGLGMCEIILQLLYLTADLTEVMVLRDHVALLRQACHSLEAVSRAPFMSQDLPAQLSLQFNPMLLHPVVKLMLCP